MIWRPLCSPSAPSPLSSVLLDIYCPKMESENLTVYRDLHKLLRSTRSSRLCMECNLISVPIQGICEIMGHVWQLSKATSWILTLFCAPLQSSPNSEVLHQIAVCDAFAHEESLRVCPPISPSVPVAMQASAAVGALRPDTYMTSATYLRVVGSPPRLI